MVVRHDANSLFFFFLPPPLLFMRTFTTSFPFVTNICVHVAETKAAPVKKYLAFFQLWQAICIPVLHSKSRYYTKIPCYIRVLWKVGSSEQGVIPSKLMNRGRKYPPQNQEKDEGTPFKERKLAALHTGLYQLVAFIYTDTWGPSVHQRLKISACTRAD